MGNPWQYSVSVIPSLMLQEDLQQYQSSQIFHEPHASVLSFLSCFRSISISYTSWLGVAHIHAVLCNFCLELPGHTQTTWHSKYSVVWYLYHTYSPIGIFSIFVYSTSITAQQPLGFVQGCLSHTTQGLRSDMVPWSEDDPGHRCPKQNRR